MSVMVLARFAGRVATGARCVRRDGEIVKSQREIEEMADAAKLAAGYGTDGYVPLGQLPGEDEQSRGQARDDRSYAEGAEAGLRWALGRAGSPLPR